jgi:ribose 1,5-bisphosphokinase PhnN
MGPSGHGKHHSLKEVRTAMKEKIRVQPLQLSRETIRQLDNDKLVHVGGGCDTTSLTTERPTTK